MLALCLMLLVTYHALNYAGIIGLGLSTVPYLYNTYGSREHVSPPLGQYVLMLHTTNYVTYASGCFSVDKISTRHNNLSTPSFISFLPCLKEYSTEG